MLDKNMSQPSTLHSLTTSEQFDTSSNTSKSLEESLFVQPHTLPDPGTMEITTLEPSVATDGNLDISGLPECSPRFLSRYELLLTDSEVQRFNELFLAGHFNVDYAPYQAWLILKRALYMPNSPEFIDILTEAAAAKVTKIAQTGSTKHPKATLRGVRRGPAGKSKK